MRKKYLVLPFGILFGIISFSLRAFPDQITRYSADTDPIKQAAFEVLVSKCNACHQMQKPTYVFTLDNMDGYAQIINKQVFIKNKMPKGEGNELTNAESEALKKWLQLNK